MQIRIRNTALKYEISRDFPPKKLFKNNCNVWVISQQYLETHSLCEESLTAALLTQVELGVLFLLLPLLLLTLPLLHSLLLHGCIRTGFLSVHVQVGLEATHVDLVQRLLSYMLHLEEKRHN